MRIAHGRADLQPAIGKRLDLVERQAVDVDDMPGPLDVQLHQVEQGCPARYEPRPGFPAGGYRAERVLRTMELERLHGSVLA